MAKRYHRGNQKREEEQIIQWFKDTTEVTRSREEEQTIQWIKDTTEVIRSREEEQIIPWQLNYVGFMNNNLMTVYIACIENTKK